MHILDTADFIQGLLAFFLTPFGLALIGVTVVSVAIDRAFPRRRRRASPYYRHGEPPLPRSHPKTFRRSRPPGRIHRRYDAESLGDIRNLSADEFEGFVADLFVKRGYQADIVGGDGDHGVDIVVKSPQGERELVQCKRWDRKWIGEPVVRDFYGAFVHDGQAVRGYIVTTSVFSDAAWAWAAGKPIDLIDGERLAEAVEAIGR